MFTAEGSDFVMQVWADCIACLACEGNHMSTLNGLTHANMDKGQVGVKREVSTAWMG